MIVSLKPEVRRLKSDACWPALDEHSGGVICRTAFRKLRSAPLRSPLPGAEEQVDSELNH